MNKNSKGFHPPSGCRGGLAVPFPFPFPLMLMRFPPGLINVKRCTSGTTLAVRTLVLPSVAAAMEASSTDDVAV